MDMSGLVSWLKDKMGGAQPLQDAQGTKYGPAMARISRVPVAFTTNISHQGEFDPATNTISINPLRDDQDPHSVMAHEQTHAIMNMLGPQGNAAATASPLYPEVASRLGGLGGGVPEHEAPAVAASGSIYGLDDAKRRQYQNDVALNIKALGRPDVASMYGRVNQ